MSDATRSYSASGTDGRLRMVVFWPEGHVIRLLEPGRSVVLGRSPDCDVFVQHDSVSRRHLRLHASRAGEAVLVEDLGSSNGSRLDGEPLPPGERVALRPRQIVRFGAASVLVDSGDAPGRADDDAARRAGVAAGTKTPGRQSPKEREAFLRALARSTITVLILGETGAGKEVTAETIHRLSTRAERPLVKLNCAALPESLLESELFGHERGAFTGAVQPKAGLLESADGGTVLLDEIGELTLATQAKLLRVLDTGEVMRIGSLRPREIDVRFLAATNRDLDAMTRERTFREDLFFRLNGLVIHVPPLRERADEIPDLAEALLAKARAKLGAPAARIAPPAMEWLVQQPWPGNVRQLRNVMDRAAVLCSGDVVTFDDVARGDARGDAPASRPPSVAPADAGALDAGGQLRDQLRAVEREKIVAALREAGGNQSRAAEILGLSRRSLIRRMEEYTLPRPRKGS